MALSVCNNAPMIQIAAPFGVKGDRQYVTPQFGKSNACNSALNANFAEGLRWQTIHPRPKCGQTETRSQATLQSVNDSAFSQLSYDPKNVRNHLCLWRICCTCVDNCDI